MTYKELKEITQSITSWKALLKNQSVPDAILKTNPNTLINKTPSIQTTAVSALLDKQSSQQASKSTLSSIYASFKSQLAAIRASTPSVSSTSVNKVDKKSDGPASPKM